MITYQGERVTLQAGVPSLYTMGVSLGRIVRFTGHCKHVYTVLPHTLVVAALMPEEIGIHGFFHDTPEVLVSDVPTPMKSQIARNREKVLLERIYHANGLEWPIPDDVMSELEEADHKALVAEAHVLEHPGTDAIWGRDYDKEAARLTRKHLAKVPEYMQADVAGPLFEKTFKKYAKQAGFDDPGAWR